MRVDFGLAINNGRNDERERRRGRRRRRRVCASASTRACVRAYGVSFTNGKAMATFSRTFYTCGFHSPLRPCDCGSVSMKA